MGKMVRYHRLGEPEDIANVVTFLLSDDGAYVNGQIIAVDGGTVLGR
jgi:NAD(P)-dependent dehydrogenase (short-subunit alcohol dehydrogenase family)